MSRINQIIAEELSVKNQQVTAAVKLLDEGATVPFIARYRKELTNGLDDTQLRQLEQRLRYLRELDERRSAVLEIIRAQNKLTPDLEQALLNADSKTRLEDLYLPYKKKRRTKSQIAREAGLQPLANALLNDPTLAPDAEAKSFINPDMGIMDTQAALDGARQILMETFAEDAELVGNLRDYLWQNGLLSSRVVSGKEQHGAKFSDYFDYSERISKVPSHRSLAMFRGCNEDVLSLKLDVEKQDGMAHPCEMRIAKRFGIEHRGRPGDDWLRETVQWSWKVKLRTRLDLDLKTRLRTNAEDEAIRVFASNLHDLLLAAPAGPRSTMGLDPGLRTGVKVAVIDATGKLVDTATIFPHAPQNHWDASIDKLASLAHKHHVELVSIGNGTASRETDRLVAELMRQRPQLGLQRLLVSEAGASVYSASALAAKEFPGLDVSLRGAVSIARRLQDPLAELVKIEPRSIGVGQYQHDVSETKLARSLDAVVEDCVNAVGVDVNTASVPLLTRVSGFNLGLANSLVEYRNRYGAFKDRKQLLKVPRLGAKTFEQAAGFMRIMNGANPLDASAVHPEAYPVVKCIVTKTGRNVKSLIGDTAFLKTLDARHYTDARFGIPTVSDIITELDKPGRDPRPQFKTAAFKEGVETLEDLHPDMILEGVVTNVTNFGAFVDIGVHQDGLVHISALADKFVKDPREIVKTGDLVKVKIIDVDSKRRRIALTMRLSQDSRMVPTKQKNESTKPRKRHEQKTEPQESNAMAEALRRAMRKP